MISTPSLKGSKIPSGHVLINCKYKGSSLVKEAQSTGLQIMYDELGFIDCFPTTHCAVVVATEQLIITELELKAKIKHLLKYKFKKVLLFEQTDISEQYLHELQGKSIEEDWDVAIVLFTSEKEIATMLSQFSHLDKDMTFLKKTAEVPVERAMLNVLLSFQGVGEKKAVDLLKKFGSLKNIFEAPISDLSEIIGERSAILIKKTYKEK